MTVQFPKYGAGFETQPITPSQPDQQFITSDPPDLSSVAAVIGIEPEYEESTEIPDDSGPDSGIDVPDVGDEPKRPVPVPSSNLEPWFYSWSQSIGAIFLVSGIVAFALPVIGPVALFVLAEGPLPIALVVAIAVSGLVAAISLLAFGTLILLIVDAARNIRQMRFSAEQTESILRIETRNRG